jgi:hypothetical protein
MVFLIALVSNQVQSQVQIETSRYRVISHFQDNALEQSLNSGTTPAAILKVFVGDDVDSIIERGLSIMGNYKVVPGQIVFEPVIPFSVDLQYFTTFGDSVIHRFSFDDSNATNTRLTGIYPAADTLPENLLKIYLEFSGPMREGEVYDKVYLNGPDGLPVRDPFVRLEPELWDYNNHRITLWIDPGRIKRSLMSSEAFGPVLETGNRYQLIVDSSWKDANGRALDQTYQKSFFVQSADRDKPATGRWEVKAPEALTKDALVIRFDKTMDFSTTLNSFKVFHPAGHRLKGLVTTGEMEKLWIFTPDQNWGPGRYHIKVKSILEDLAGNNLNRVFDRDLHLDSQQPAEKEFYQIKFEVL